MIISNNVLCPRCGAIGKLDLFKRGGREYLRVVHGRRHCYIGPREGYVHVEELHQKTYAQPLDLTNLLDANPLDIAVNSLELFLKVVSRKRVDTSEVEEKLREIERIIKEIRDYLASYTRSEER